MRRHCHSRQALPFQPPYHQSFGSVQPIHALRARAESSLSRQRVQSPVPVAWFLTRQIHNLLAKRRVVIRPRLVTITAAIDCDQLAGPTFAHPELLTGERHIGPHAGKLHPFFRITAFSTSLSRLRSATRCFSRRFSSSRPLSRCASLTSMPPYFDFQV